MSLKLTVLKTRQPIGDFFIASMKAKDLVDISYNDVRRLAEEQRDVERYLGIQRPVSPKRIKEIKKYIQADDSTFPTSVILAVDDKCAEYKAINDQLGELTLSEFKSEDSSEMDIAYSKIAKVIDGQHRIAAFMDEGHNWSFDYGDRDFDINVAIFIGADLSEQANIFATVNLAQTKVNKSLVYDLTELAKTPSPHKTCHNVAVVLDKENSSPLHHRIKRLGTATPGRKNEPLTQASFVESLVKFLSPDPVKDRNTYLAGKKVQRAGAEELIKFPFRNLFIDGKDLDIVEILYNYFTAIEKKWPNSWAAVGQVGNLLPRSNTFKAFMIYLRENVYLDLVGNDFGAIPTIEEFENSLSHIVLQDEDFSTRNFAPGSGGQSTFLKILRGQLSLEDITED